ncbi:MAG: glycosyltransferase family 61 protein [Chitinophagales bacterium]|nr:glycosyltransferase family 61 protein [Hyphomicrobiales bacterium]
MAKIRYKQRIHKNKLSARSLRYAAADQMVRLFPALRERWMFPVDAVPMAEAAVSAAAFDTLVIDAQPPGPIARLVKRPTPLKSVQKVYTFHDATVIGQSGALIQHGKLLAVRPNPNWAVSLRPRNYARRDLQPGVLHYLLMPPVPAIGHVFHWLFDYVTPFMTWLEERTDREPVQPIVNGKLTEFQRRTLDFLVAHYGLLAPIGVGADEAAFAPGIATSVLEPFAPRAMQAPAGLKALAALGRHLSGGKADTSARRRLYISRNDAKLRRVANEAELGPMLKAHGFESIILKGMPIADQVRLFIEAEGVVAPHGAGLAHIAWMRPGAKVTEFFPAATGPYGAPKNATANFWIISNQQGLDYSAYEASAQTSRHDLFEIPLDLMGLALKQHFALL